MDPPASGSAYYILGKSYIAASLNLLNKAPIPAQVQAALDRAAEIFETYSAAQVGAFKKKERSELINLKEILDQYNNGILGAEKCTE